MEEKTKGRKRHIVVDTMGNLLAVVVHAANIHDTKAGIWAAKKAFETYPSIQRFCADAGYRKTFEQDVSSELGAWRRYFGAYQACMGGPAQAVDRKAFSGVDQQLPPPFQGL